jgi:hypothetical protein
VRFLSWRPARETRRFFGDEQNRVTISGRSNKSLHASRTSELLIESLRLSQLRAAA